MRVFLNIPFLTAEKNLEVAQFSMFVKNQGKKTLRAIAKRFIVERLEMPLEYCAGVNFVGLAENKHQDGVFYPFAKEAGIAKKISFVYEGFCLEKNEPVERLGWRTVESAIENLPFHHTLHPSVLFGGDHVWRSMLRRAKLFGPA